ncbi:MAG: hypothetical protein AAF985_23910 [Bacteroidota bacterium]
MFFVLEPTEEQMDQPCYESIYPATIVASDFQPQAYFFLYTNTPIPQAEQFKRLLMKQGFYRFVWLRRMHLTIEIQLVWPTEFPQFAIRELHRFFDQHMESINSQNNEQQVQPLPGHHQNDHRAA